MKHRLPGGAKEFFRERQQIWRPRADGHDNEIARNSFAIVQHDPFHAIRFRPDAKT